MSDIRITITPRLMVNYHERIKSMSANQNVRTSIPTGRAGDNSAMSPIPRSLPSLPFPQPFSSLFLPYVLAYAITYEYYSRQRRRNNCASK